MSVRVPEVAATTERPPNILQAMDQYFAKTFRRDGRLGDTWKAWRAFLAAIFGIAMDAEAQAIYRQHTGRDDMPSQQFREVYAIVGRRGGKSIIAALVAAFLASFRDYSDVLGPGETGVVMLLAADQKQAKVLLGHIKALFKIPALKRLVVGGTADSITLTGRISIEVHASSFRTVRGFTSSRRSAMSWHFGGATNRLTRMWKF